MSEDAAAVTGLPAGQTGESLSCVTCRNRKLRCDKTKPVCTRCAKGDSECVYPTCRKKPTLKRKNVAELEERLAQVENLLRRSQSGEARPVDAGTHDGEFFPNDILDTPAIEDILFQGIDYGTSDGLAFTFGQANTTTSTFPGSGSSAQPTDDYAGSLFNGELIGLGGVFEALPPFEVMEDLNRLYFERQYQFAPIIHPGRYFQAFYSAPHMKPPMCLQYAIWALASNNDAKYHTYHDVFYRRARQYAELDEMKGHGEHFITTSHAQTWCVLATDEAKSTMFTRAAMSCARAVRLVLMMGLHHLDAPPDESSPTLAPPRDWAELEERRRTFWGVFCIDSHCSISTGWPHLIDMSEVTTHLPATEAAFHTGEPLETYSIHDVFRGEHPYSSFAGNAIVCHIFNLILRHAHRLKANDSPEDYEHGAYWNRHRDLDNTLSSAFMFLPPAFGLPDNYRDLTAVNLNLNLHASVICLHHAAIERIESNNLSESLLKVSQGRLATAAQEIINILKLTSHLSTNPKTPLAALSLFCAATVYIYFCRPSPSPSPSLSPSPSHITNLDFILSSMEAIGRTHSMTRSFLDQAILDIEANGIDMTQIPTAHRLRLRLVPRSSSVHNIPLLARTRLSRHSEARPPLPGLIVTRSNSSSYGFVSSSDVNKRKRMTTTTTTNTTTSKSKLISISPAVAPFTRDGGGHSHLPIRSEQPPREFSSLSGSNGNNGHRFEQSTSISGQVGGIGDLNFNDADADPRGQY
ncbi:hypothetical protein GGS20DRAFT_536077 [Poronia punctata]|nr:hypothetical protein GGS20DRAFT_536077 [Poronia punctata]